MNDPNLPAATPFDSWIGRREVQDDILTPRIVAGFAATLGLEGSALATGDVAPPGVHWCLCPSAVPTAALASDGHPPKGSFLPPIDLPRRMWAGGTVHHHANLRIGDAIRRCSEVTDIRARNGRSGALWFVTVRHSFNRDLRCLIEEDQTIVYRGAETTPTPATRDSIERVADFSEAYTVNEIELFRYSALTFNGHRIHYDGDYVREVEGYPGLVVHGPLQATRLLQLATRWLRSAPQTFEFRAVSPLFGPTAYRLCAIETNDALDLWCEDAAGRTTMTATATKSRTRPDGSQSENDTWHA